MTRTLFPTDTIVPPKDDPAVQARGRELQAARTALSDIERRARELEVERDSSDELRVLTAAYELSDLRQRYIGAKAARVTATRAYDEAFQKARGPWLQQTMATYREAALTYLRFLEDVALPANQAMHEAHEKAQQAGLRVDPLTVPALFPEAIAHRCKVGRQGLG